MCQLAMQMNDRDIYTNNKYYSKSFAPDIALLFTLFGHMTANWWWWCIGHILSPTVHCTPMSMLHSFIFSVIKLRFLWRGNAMTKSTTTPTTITIKCKKKGNSIYSLSIIKMKSDSLNVECNQIIIYFSWVWGFLAERATIILIGFIFSSAFCWILKS